MGYRWRGFEHPELYKMINSGPGASASEPQTTYWTSLTDELTQVDEALNNKLKTMGAAWEGQAADRAQSGLTPLAEWASDAETGASVMRISAENQADYISDARANMPEPVPVTTPAPSGWQMAAAAVSAATFNPGPALAVAAQAADHEAQEAAQSEAEQQAVRTMQNYESSSTWNRDTLGTFVAPPDVVVSTPPPQGGTPGFVTGPESTTGANASGSTTPAGGPTATIPTGGGGTGGTLVPNGGGNPVPATTLPTGSNVLAPPATTTPAGLLPSGQPVGGPPAQPGPSLPTPPVTNPSPAPGPALPPGLANPANPPVGANGPQNNAGNRGPLFGGRGPFPAANPVGGNPPVPVNAGDVARRGTPPLRGGLPAGGFGGPGAVAPDAVRQGSQYGRGTGAGGAVPGQSAVRSGPGAAAAAGGRGAAVGGAGARGGVAGPMGAGGRRADDEDDEERYAPDYLLETEDVFGDDRRVSPTVIGGAESQE